MVGGEGVNPDRYRRHVRLVVDQAPDLTEADLIDLAALLPQGMSGPRPLARAPRTRIVHSIVPPDSDELGVAA